MGSIKRDERIRLKDGRLMTLDAAELETGKYEVMLYNPKTFLELDVVQVPTEAEALEEFERLRKEWHHPEAMPAELKGQYRKLAEDLKAALAYGLERKGDDDGGTSNFDAPSLSLPGWQRKKVEAAAEYAGLGCFIWNLWGSKSFVFSLPMGCGVGQGMTRTKAAEAMLEYLKGLGYDAMLYCQAD